VTPVNSAEVEAVHFSFTPPSAGYTSIARLVVQLLRPCKSQMELEEQALLIHIEPKADSRSHRSPAVDEEPVLPVVPVAGVSGRMISPTPTGALTAAGSTIAAHPVRPAGPLGPAHRLDEIVASTDDGSLTISIKGDGALDYEVFPLDAPPRLVVDFRGVSNDVRRGRIAVNALGVRQIRVAQFQLEPQRIARVVLDMDGFEPYKLVPTPDGTLHVRFGDLDWDPPELRAQVAASLTEPLSEQEPYPGYPSRELAQADTLGEPVSTDETDDLLDFEAQVLGEAGEEEGELISLDLKDADIKDILRYFSELSGLNIILDPEVSGDVTVRLIDVPWNRALDIILKAHGYDRVLDGNVLRIASVDKLRAEAEAAAALKAAEFEAVDLVTVTKAVSYGSAEGIKTVLQDAALTPRGTIIVDDRTQTLVIQDVNIPEVQQRILDLIETLDQPTPQVEIEARVVETLKTFSQSFGIQWGFNVLADQSTGTTTDLIFPNNYAFKGDRIVSDQGGFESDLPNRGWAVNLPGSGATGAVGLQFGNILDTFSLDVMLSALENEGYGRILAAPKVTTQNNTSAEMESGTQIPVQVIANNTITTQFVSASLRLIVTPQITADRTIIMDLTVEQNEPDFARAIGPGAVPPITTRRADTKLLVADGGTAVIGGVFKVTEAKATARVPGLHRLPLLGWLFKNKNDTRENTELLIFITPKIKKLVR
jgi:type IV pilus assembly protein PilQ